jgi:hypothetical protein
MANIMLRWEQVGLLDPALVNRPLPCLALPCLAIQSHPKNETQPQSQRTLLD